ncbi:hypothetical protein HBH56_155820 [Parastagonospora nodorum]|uniref:Uncharacterized protein n=1 Tax=Phaeosphaeria nodorum (strain SN15 / ATCC MYA-4574 / FGSC 10173) TaxID=321614 RepID=A0A7U2EZ84_PHANO|nr:hypothetical protein HBH56_155820 [Parastagonospora nodorum]QRC95828.1 hypothetical protein JI435_054800 [Parastagonospora nodorum SN15]KAH3926798.1 hypothetical protein HBH54_161850 [Parastagonospora nodorum]KAH3972142.1 hypothetical protein HBH51_104190 [Parastagonospora nodorum]KAH4134765.1 hypothetical protein HBH45_156800 [Parastagonospora nodorum]
MPDNNKGRREEHATSNLDPQAGYLPDTSSGDPEFDAMFAEELIEVYVKRGTGDFETAEQLEASIDREATHHILLASVSAEPKFSATGYSSRGPIETANGAKAVEPAPGSGRDPTDRAWMTLRTDRRGDKTTEADRRGQSYVCIPCAYMKRKIVSNETTNDKLYPNRDGNLDLAYCQECEATYHLKGGRGKATPGSHGNICTGLVEYKGDDRVEKAPWICTACLNSPEDKRIRYCVFVNKAGTKECYGCTNFAKHIWPPGRVETDAHFVIEGTGQLIKRK